MTIEKSIGRKIPNGFFSSYFSIFFMFSLKVAHVGCIPFLLFSHTFNHHFHFREREIGRSPGLKAM